MPEYTLSAEERAAIGERIDRLRHAKRLTLAELASKAGYDERTGRNIIQGRPTRYKTLLHFCEAVGLPDIHARNDVAEFADDSHGGYSRRSFNSYLSHYIAFHWSYDESGNIIRSYFRFYWSQEKGVLFSENEKYRTKSGRSVDFSQSGELYANEEAGLIHLVTIVEGMVRLVTLTRLQPSGMLKGAVLTQAVLSFYRRPAASPILLRKLADEPSIAEMEKTIGEMMPSDSGYDEEAAELRAIERDILLSTVGMDPQRRRSDLGSNVTLLTSIR